MTFSVPVFRRLAIGSGRMLSKRRSERSFSALSRRSASSMARENRKPITPTIANEPIAWLVTVPAPHWVSRLGIPARNLTTIESANVLQVQPLVVGGNVVANAAPERAAPKPSRLVFLYGLWKLRGTVPPGMERAASTGLARLLA
jgi:hypothetical protein